MVERIIAVSLSVVLYVLAAALVLSWLEERAEAQRKRKNTEQKKHP